jgi:hypothetical protein
MSVETIVHDMPGVPVCDTLLASTKDMFPGR